ncbi:hypothetical protein K435DRAFT_876950 [Dendrothele bispora CBS 962.96]|uniref:Uncharacterized protein n=1 Tax=Dendrothele bispora (strain CBS 962.96) TaxID=1314807 RepID=A0A4S8KR22_DENBC|nr:hypothetical protein K435DRAFT_876950 [Dendrothele bispora CBS 962.96]
MVAFLVHSGIFTADCDNLPIIIRWRIFWFYAVDAEIAQLEAALSVLRHKRRCLQDYPYSPSSTRHPPPHLSYPLSSVTNPTILRMLEQPQIVRYLFDPGFDWLAKSNRRSKDEAGFQHRLSFYLERSLQAPLTVYLSMYYDSSHLDGDWHAALGKILRPVYRRCGSLIIDHDNCYGYRLPVHTPSIASITDLPCLEYLKLPAGSLMEDWTPALPIYQGPRLRHLEITPVNRTMNERLHKYNSSIFQQFPWAQITTFEMSKLYHVLELWKFLGRCIHLSELTVREVFCFNLAHCQDYLDFMNTTELFTLPYLISIDIGFFESNDLDCGFPSFSQS